MAGKPKLSLNLNIEFKIWCFGFMDVVEKRQTVLSKNTMAWFGNILKDRSLRLC
jgi:hypothetical protein